MFLKYHNFENMYSLRMMFCFPQIMYSLFVQVMSKHPNSCHPACSLAKFDGFHTTWSITVSKASITSHQRKSSPTSNITVM